MSIGLDAPVLDNGRFPGKNQSVELIKLSVSRGKIMSEKKYPIDIVVDHENMTVTAGAFSKSEFFLFPKRKEACVPLIQNIIPNAPYFGKTSYDGHKKAFTFMSNELGSFFFRGWFKAMHQLWVNGNQRIIYRLCIDRKGKHGELDAEKVKAFHKHKLIIAQAIADGIEHSFLFSFALSYQNAGRKTKKRIFIPVLVLP